MMENSSLLERTDSGFRAEVGSVSHAVERVVVLAADVDRWAPDVPHALRGTTQTLFCLRGQISVFAEQRTNAFEMALKPGASLVLKPMTWTRMLLCTADTIALMVFDAPFDAEDRIESHDAWFSAVGLVED